jgi:hypothetical protein
MIPLSLLRKIDKWLRQHSPVWCVRCHKMVQQKNTHAEFTTSGVVATLCHKCHRELYTPWGK